MAFILRDMAIFNGSILDSRELVPRSPLPSQPPPPSKPTSIDAAVAVAAVVAEVEVEVVTAAAAIVVVVVEAVVRASERGAAPWLDLWCAWVVQCSSESSMRAPSMSQSR
jgi:hypothetical protein